ncbi:hypothetical protein [uncultured Paraglaciecola sp.]|uniref:hypothetical protein n=1 Tax=uncultured Paraglaciecola sp. TaxID=1765024 RepID=UPI0030D9B446|tara:strand:+ start:86367 stop:87035 length:669 start_codon:yes stop_codon:yes gene_type:complete
MQILTKFFGLLLIGSVALNLYQYQQVKKLSLAPEKELSFELTNSKESYLSDTKNNQKPNTVPNFAINNTAPSYNPAIVNKDDLQAQTANVSHNEDEEYSEAFFEYEFSLYLDDEVIESVKNTSPKDKIKIVNMFNNAEVRAQDLELESEISKLFEKYRESIKSGSAEVRCNSVGCYSSYVLSDPKAMNHLFLDWPSTKGEGFSTLVNYPDGTFRNIDFKFHP